MSKKKIKNRNTDFKLISLFCVLMYSVQTKRGCASPKLLLAAAFARWYSFISLENLLHAMMIE